MNLIIICADIFYWLSNCKQKLIIMYWIIILGNSLIALPCFMDQNLEVSTFKFGEKIISSKLNLTVILKLSWEHYFLNFSKVL